MSRYVMCPDCGRRMNRYKDMWQSGLSEMQNELPNV